MDPENFLHICKLFIIDGRNLDHYVDIAISLNGDPMFTCPDEITGVSCSKVIESTDFVEDVDRRS